ncbi:MAG: hypothetical protein EXR77_18150 [Myxococcales bacterium]|nr:hypothetical protein [Myxococcales bacterium]
MMGPIGLLGALGCFVLATACATVVTATAQADAAAEAAPTAETAATEVISGTAIASTEVAPAETTADATIDTAPETVDAATDIASETIAEVLTDAATKDTAAVLDATPTGTDTAAVDAAVEIAPAVIVCPGGTGCACKKGNECSSGVCLPGAATGTAPSCAQACPPECSKGAVCTAIGPYSACVLPGQAPCSAVAESCNGIDDDCDGKIDNAACDDQTPCSVDDCDPKKALCSHTVAPDGVVCTDQNPCTEGDICFAGACTPGKKMGCDDLNPCTWDLCLPKEATCSALPMGPGTPCDDGNKCTADGGCQKGKCEGGTGTACDDKISCTTDSCDPVIGCSFKAVTNGNVCDDANLCTTTDVCTNGSCVGKKVNCDDLKPCTTNTCDPLTAECSNAPFAEGAYCDDGSKCSQGETCQNVVCKGGATMPCTDSNPCTTELCDVKTGDCVYTFVAAGTVCDDGIECTTSACGGGQCILVGHSCSCMTATACNDGNPCTTDTCTSKKCSHGSAPIATSCSDGSACTLNDLCQGTLCKPGADVVCNDNKPCTVDGCSADKGCVHLSIVADTVCDDGDKCTNGDLCAGSKGGDACVGKPTVCIDNLPCTSDACDQAAGCIYKAIPACVPTVTFADIQAQVLGPYCSGCHTFTQPGMVDKQAPVGSNCETSKYVVAGKPKESLFYAKLDPTVPMSADCGGKMPKKAPGPGLLPAAVLILVENWIAGGAKP